MDLIHWCQKSPTVTAQQPRCATYAISVSMAVIPAWYWSRGSLCIYSFPIHDHIWHIINVLNQAEPRPECITRSSNARSTEQALAYITELPFSYQQGVKCWMVNEIKLIVTKFKSGSESRFFFKYVKLLDPTFLSSAWCLNSRSNVLLPSRGTFLSAWKAAIRWYGTETEERSIVQGEETSRTKGAALKWRRHLKWLNKQEKI